MQRNQLSLPQQNDYKTRNDKKVYRKTRTNTFGVTENNTLATATGSSLLNKHQLQLLVGGFGGGGLK